MVVTNGPDVSPPLILTVMLDDASQAFFDHARERWFPAELNFIRAHVTLFHRLPGDHLAPLTEHLRTICARQSPVGVSITGVRSLGRGVAYSLAMPEVASLRARLAAQWRQNLTAQDRQGWRPHVTVQNKVSPKSANDLLGQLSRNFVPFAATATGLALWRYCGGPWASEAMLPFAG